MDIGSIFLILGLLVLVGLFIGRPLLERQATVVSQEEHQYSSLLAERDRILNALQELDFDYTLGKIPEADYPGQRASLLTRGADVLRQLDAFGAETTEEDAEARLEAVIAVRRADIASNGSPGRILRTSPDDDLEALIASRRRVRSEKARGFCPQCGRPVQNSDRFCPNCGTTLA